MSRKSIDDLINASKQASLSLPESSAIKTIQKAMQAMQFDHLASLSLPESPAMGTVRKATQGIQASHLASLSLPESPAMETVRKAVQAMQFNHLASLTLPKSSAMKTIQKAAQASLKVSLEFPEPAVIKLAQEAMQERHMASLAFQETSAMKSMRQMLDFNPLAGLGKLSSLKAAAQLENSPFSKSTLAAFESLATNYPVQSNEGILEIASQISKEVSLETDFNALSEKTKNLLLYLYHNYLLPVVLSFFVSYTMMNTATEARKELKSLPSLAEVRSFTRATNIKLDRVALSGFRVTTANSLKLRKNPNMSAEIIDFLPLGTLVEIIDRSHRSWLFVELELDGEVKQGWVSRKYTAYFK